MELRQLEAFSAVISSGSVTAAARMLSRSQPAITRLVQELEAEIGHALFARKGPRITPTEMGFLLHEDVQRALAGMQQIPLRAAEIARGRPQPLLLAATSAMSLGLLPAALRQVQEQLGLMPVQLQTASPEQVVHAVLSGSAHLGASSLPLEHRGVDVQWIGQLPCVAVLPAGDPLARRKTVPLASLAERRLITMSNPFRLRHRLDAALAGAGRTPALSEGLIETNSSANALALARAGLGVAVLEPLTARGLALDGLVVRELDADIPFYFGVVTLQDRPLAAAVAAVSRALLKTASRLPGFVRHDPAHHGALVQKLQPAPGPARAARTRRKDAE